MLINLQLTSNLYVAMSYVSNDISNEHDHESDWFHSSLEIGWCFFLHQMLLDLKENEVYVASSAFGGEKNLDLKCILCKKEKLQKMFACAVKIPLCT